MKISIWQQWASNHSGWVYVVGVFASTEMANTAAAAVYDILQDIYAWYDTHDESHLSRHEPSPPELAFSQQYDVPWPHRIDFDELDDAIEIADRLVFVRNPEETWTQKEPFESFFRNFGAQATGLGS